MRRSFDNPFGKYSEVNSVEVFTFVLRSFRAGSCSRINKVWECTEEIEVINDKELKLSASEHASIITKVLQSLFRCFSVGKFGFEMNSSRRYAHLLLLREIQSARSRNEAPDEIS